MSREQEDPYKLIRTDIFNSVRTNFGSIYVNPQCNTRTTTSSYCDSPGNIRRNFDSFSSSKNNLGDAANMPIFVEDGFESDMLSRNRNINPTLDPKNSSTSPRVHTIPSSSALEALQDYGPVMQSPSHSPMQKDWNLDYQQSIDMKNTTESTTFSLGMLNSEDTFKKQKHPNETSARNFNDMPSCKAFNDLNLKSVDEEDEFLYGDSNSLSEEPKSLKNDPVQCSDKLPNTGWSDDEDLFGESPNTLASKLKSNPVKSCSIWNIQNKNIESKVPKNKHEGNMKKSESGKTLPKKTFAEHHHSSVNSITEEQEREIFSSKRIASKNLKTIVSDKDSQVTSGLGVKSKYHIAAQILKKQPVEKSSNLTNKTLSSSDFNDPNKTLKSVSDADEKLATKTNISVRISKTSDLKTNKPPVKNERQLPKAFLQKDLDGIKEYIGGSRRKRVHPQEEYEHEMKHTKHEKHREMSPSRHHSPYESRHRSPINEYRHRSPYRSKHKSPVNDVRYHSPTYRLKYKSPDREYDKHCYEHSPRHHSYEGHRYSRSPFRKSKERSPGYYRYKMRSPGLHRSKRSRSPGHRRSRERSFELNYKKNLCRSYKDSKTPEHYPSKKVKKSHDYSSDDSFCSLSFESKSSDSSDGSSDVKEKSPKKLPKTKAPETFQIDSSKTEKKTLEDVRVKAANTPLSSNISQNLSDNCSFQDKTTRNVELKNDDSAQNICNIEADKLINIMKVLTNSRMITDIVAEVHQEQSSTFTSSAPSLANVTHNINNLPAPNINLPSSNPPIPSMSGLQSYPSMSSPQSYVSMSGPQPYPIMPPPLNIPFPMPQVNSLPPLTFPPPPVTHAVPASMYGPFPASIQPVDVSRAVETKPVIKKRPVTLRPIAFSDSLDSTKNNGVNIQNISSKSSSNEPLKSQEKSLAKLKYNSVEKEKTTSETNVSSNAKPTIQCNTEQNVLLIEKFKKLKSERSIAHYKVNSSVRDVVQMREMMEKTVVKKTNSYEKTIQSKCKSILAVSSDAMNYFLKDAKRLDEELSRFKGKLSKELRAEVAKIKVEHCKEPDNSNEVYSCYDPRSHFCYLCFKQLPNLSSMMEHLQSTEHKELMSSEDYEWTKQFKKEPKKDDSKKSVSPAVAGVDFIKPFTGFFCTLCSETLPDGSIAEQHLKSHDHYVNYGEFLKINPLYERKYLFKRYIHYFISSKEKKNKEVQEKVVELANRRKNEDAADEKVKEMIRDQKSKEKVVEELEEVDSDTPAKNQNLAGIKLILSGEKGRTKQKGKGTKESETKIIQKLVYIGKAPNYKPRPKPWYKRDIYQKNNESTSDITSSSLSTVAAPKTEEKISLPSKEVCASPKMTKLCLKQEIPEPTIKKNQILSDKKAIKYTCLTEEECKNLSCNVINVSKPGENIKSVPNQPVKNSDSESGKNGNNNSVKNNNNEFAMNRGKESLKDNDNDESEKNGNNNSVKNENNESEMNNGKESLKDNDNDSIQQSDCVVRERDASTHPDSLFVNQIKSESMPHSEDPAVNQAIKNILLGTDSSLHQDIPLSEIKLPEIPTQSSVTSNVQSTLPWKSNSPIPMEIDEFPDKSDSNLQPDILTEEDRDFFILGINKDDLRPLVVPIPPPSSLLNSTSPSHTPSFINTSGTMGIPVSISAHQSKSPNLKKQTFESKSSKSNRTIVPVNDPFQSDSLARSHIENTTNLTVESDLMPEKVSEPLTKYQANESEDRNQKAAIDEICVKFHYVNADCNTAEKCSREQNIPHKNETVLGTQISEIMKLTKCEEEQHSIAAESSECVENVNKNNSEILDCKEKARVQENIESTELSISNLCDTVNISRDPIAEKSTASTGDLVNSNLKQVGTNMETVSVSHTSGSFIIVDDDIDNKSVLTNCQDILKTDEVIEGSSVNYTKISVCNLSKTFSKELSVNSEVNSSQQQSDGIECVFQGFLMPNQARSVNDACEERSVCKLDSSLSKDSNTGAEDCKAKTSKHQIEEKQLCISMGKEVGEMGNQQYEKSEPESDSPLSLNVESLRQDSSQESSHQQLNQVSSADNVFESIDQIQTGSVKSASKKISEQILFGDLSRTFEPKVKEISPNKPVVQMKMIQHAFKSDPGCSSVQSNQDLCKSISYSEICSATHETEGLNQSSEKMVFYPDSTCEQSLYGNLNSEDSVVKEISPVSQGEDKQYIKSLCEGNKSSCKVFLQPLNQGSCKESISSIEIFKTVNETIDQSKTEKMSACSLDSADRNVPEDMSIHIGSGNSDVNALAFDQQSIHMKDEQYDAKSNQELLSELSVNNIPSVCNLVASSESLYKDKTASDENDLTTRQQHYIKSESFLNFEMELDNTSSQSNAKILNKMEGTGKPVPEITLKSHLKGKTRSGDIGSKKSISPATDEQLSINNVSEKQNLLKSGENNSDTDEYENEE